MEQNPYAPSQVSPVKNSSQDSTVITPVALSAVIATKFWVRLIGVVMIIFIVLQSLSLLHILTSTSRGIPTSPLFIIVPILAIIINTTLAIRLLQYGNAISELARSREPIHFENAMEVQTKFWKLLGILGVIFAALIVISFTTGIVFT